MWMKAMVVVALSLWLAAGWLLILAARRRGPIRRLRRLLGACVCIAIGVALVSVGAVMHLFQVFSDETFVAEVSTRRLSPQVFELSYTPTKIPVGTITVRMRGDQWAISGGIVKWHPWLAALGLKSYHKPIWVSGQFSKLEQQRSHLPTVYALTPEIDQFWETLYRADPYLPFIEAVYGSSAYAYADPGVTYDVYVTASGYMIRRRIER